MIGFLHGKEKHPKIIICIGPKLCGFMALHNTHLVSRGTGSNLVKARIFSSFFCGIAKSSFHLGGLLLYLIEKKYLFTNLTGINLGLLSLWQGASAQNSLKWPIYVFNSVDDTKLPCYTFPLTQHHSFFRNLSPLFIISQSPILNLPTVWDNTLI